MSTRVPHWSPRHVKRIQSVHPHHILFKIISMFPSCTRLGPLCCLFLKLANEIPTHYSLLSRVWCVPRPHLILLLITVIIFGEECNDEVLAYSFFSSLVLLSLSVFLSAPRSLKTLGLSLAFTLRERISLLFYGITNRCDNVQWNLFLCKSTLHVSGGKHAHHQEYNLNCINSHWYNS